MDVFNSHDKHNTETQLRDVCGAKFMESLFNVLILKHKISFDSVFMLQRQQRNGYGLLYM